MRTAILFRGSGELGNRLVAFSHLFALCREEQAALCNLAFWRYAHFFAAPTPWIERPWLAATEAAPGGETRFANLLRSLLESRGGRRWREHFVFDETVLSGPAVLTRRALSWAVLRWVEQLGRKRLASLGWALSEDDLLVRPAELASLPLFDELRLIRHAEAVRARFQLAPPLADQVRAALAPLRARHSMIVGVHVRLGDYAAYRGGQWFYPLATYRRVMDEIRALHPEHEVGFLIAAKEAPDLSEFPGLAVQRAPGHLALDMYALAACDLIAGPPSTFSGWASFIGAVPYLPLETAGTAPVRREAATSWWPRFY